MRLLIYGLNFSPELTGIGKYTGEMAVWLAARAWPDRQKPLFICQRINAMLLARIQRLMVGHGRFAFLQTWV